MMSLYPRLPVTERDGGEDVDGSDYSPFYGIAVVCVSIFLFCVLAATVSVWEALAFAALAALLLAVAGCFAPGRWSRRSGRPASAAELVVTVTAAGAARPRPRAPACAFALANAPPAFAFELPLERDGGGGASCVVVCPVCLEDVRGGEMVRQVPACRHTFHVECIDMWMHAHRTCPVCRCEISPAPKATGKAAAEEAPESSVEVLPPV